MTGHAIGAPFTNSRMAFATILTCSTKGYPMPKENTFFNDSVFPNQSCSVTKTPGFWLELLRWNLRISSPKTPKLAHELAMFPEK